MPNRAFESSDVFLLELQSLIKIAACRGQVGGNLSSREAPNQVGQKFDAVRTHLYLNVGLSLFQLKNEP
jgi:hypothetical protein